MFNAKSPTIACLACGQANRAAARFCEACAARLGAEPSIAPDVAPLTTPAVRDAHGDSRFDGPRTVHSRPSPLTAPLTSNAGFWIKFGIAGLVVMIGFIAWSLFMLTGSKAPAQLPAGQAGLSTAPAASMESLHVAPSPSPSAAVAPSASPGMAALPSAVAPSASVQPSTTAETRAARSAVPPQRQPMARERARPASNEVRPTDVGAWVEPSRAPAMTSSPGYQDAGPPVVAGPGPREPIATTASQAPGSGSAVTTGRPDLGPPVTVGPGPRYDYSTPNAAGR